MDQHALRALVEDFATWQGNTYKLAALVAERQRELDAARAEAAGQDDLAAAIRANGG